MTNETIEMTHKEMKQETSKQMLDKIPKVIGKTICIVSFLCCGSITAVAVLSIIYNKPFFQICLALTLVDLLSIGLTLIAMAVSAWVGLNVYSSISRDELDSMNMEFQKEKNNLEKTVNDSLKELKKTIMDQTIIEITKEREEIIKATLKQNLIATINLQSNKYMIISYISSAIKKDEYLMESKNDYFKIISAENSVADITNYYEENRYHNCYRMSDKVLEEYRGLNKNIKANTAIKVYVDMRTADVLFYKNASAIRLNKSEMKPDENELLDSIELYAQIKEYVDKDDVSHDEKAVVDAYICNTIGYSYDLLYQITKKEKYNRKSIKQLEESIKNDKLIWNDKLSRYKRNLGLAYEHSGQYEKAKHTYIESIKENPLDYKSLNDLGNITIKMIERDLNICNRDKILPQYCSNNLEKYRNTMEEAKNYLERAVTIEPQFMDPHYKMIQICTYIYLITGNNEEIFEAQKQISFLDGIYYDSSGYLFALRNYWESIENIEEARKVNERLIEKVNLDTTDCKHIEKLYIEYLDAE